MLCSGGLESFLTAYRYLYEAKEYFQPGQLATMAPKLEQACVDSVKTVYKMKRAEVKVRRRPLAARFGHCVCLVPRSHLRALLLHYTRAHRK